MDIQASLDALLQRKELLAEQFYKTFLERYPEAQRFFQDVDTQRQAVLLTMSLTVVVSYYCNPYPASAMYLQFLGTKHHDLGIPKELYPKFRDVLLEYLEQFHGQDWDQELARQWREAIDGAVKVMLAGYAVRTTV